MAALAATLALNFSNVQPVSSLNLIHPSSFSVILKCRSKHSVSSLLLPFRSKRNPMVLAVVESQNMVDMVSLDSVEEEKTFAGELSAAADETKRMSRPCELYVCNIPRNYDISRLLELFKQYGTVLSVEVSRDPLTSVSRGCGYVTMASISEAKLALSALDGSNISGREMRVSFSAGMIPARQSMKALSSALTKNFIFESPYKIYVGNLSMSARPQELKEYFSQFGTIVSTRVLHDRKYGKSRAYAFISFSTPDEVSVAIEANGSELCGRFMTIGKAFDFEQ